METETGAKPSVNKPRTPKIASSLQILPRSLEKDPILRTHWFRVLVSRLLF